MHALETNGSPDIAITGGVPLLDAITVNHGPRRELGRFFLLASTEAEKCGVTLKLHRTLHSLVAANTALRGTPGVPIFNPYLSDLTPADSFWISGHDASGRVVATQAARIFDMRDTTAADEFTSLRLFYRDAEAKAASGIACRMEGDALRAASAVSGQIAFGGSAWLHRDFRKSGLSAIIPRIGRNLAYTLWNTNYNVTVIEDVLVGNGVFQRYGFSNGAPGVTLTGMYDHDMSLHFVWIDRVEISLDRARYMSKVAGSEVLSMTQEDTNDAPRAVQGSISRS